MKEITQLSQIYGGMSCQAALIEEAVNWSIEDITEFCTKEQFTLYAMGMIDLMYTYKPANVTDQMEIDLINSLNL